MNVYRRYFEIKDPEMLAAKLAEIEAQKPQCYYVGMIDGQHVVRMLDGSLVPAVGTAYYTHAGPVCGQPAVKDSLTTAVSAEVQDDVRRDAERYRELRDGLGIRGLPYDDHGAGPEYPSGDELDGLVDAMLAAKLQEK